MKMITPEPAVDFMPAEITVVSFDIWSTLLKSNPAYKAARAEVVLEALGSPEVGMDFMQFISHADEEIDALSDRTGEQFGFEERVAFLAAKAGVEKPNDEHMAALHSQQLALVDSFPPLLIEEDLPAVLEPLATEKQLAIISNTGFIDGGIMRGALRKLGILEHLTYQIFSNEVGVAKPDPRIYTGLVRAAGVKPEAIVHIGDNKLADYEGAKAAGMHAVHLTDGLTVTGILKEAGLV